MLQNVLIPPSHNKRYQIGTLAKGNQRNTGVTQKQSRTQKKVNINIAYIAYLTLQNIYVCH